MAKTKVDKKLEADGFELKDVKTYASMTKSYVKDGVTYMESELAVDKPKGIKERLGDLLNKGMTRLDHAHTIKTYQKIEHTPTAQGTVKKVTVCQVQNDGLDGENLNEEPTMNYTTSTGEMPESLDPLSKGERFLKNMIDGIRDSQIAQWAFIGAGLALGALALGLALH